MKNQIVKNPVPAINRSRSLFHIPNEHKTTFQVGELVPFYLNEILPGDTVSLSVSSVLRSITPLFPTMDNAYCDVYFFFVPSRLLGSNNSNQFYSVPGFVNTDATPNANVSWETFIGANYTDSWITTSDNDVTNMRTCEFISCDPGSVANHLGLPVSGDAKYQGIEINPMPFFAYNLIYRDWFMYEVTDSMPDLSYGLIANSSPNKLFIGSADGTGSTDNFGNLNSCYKVTKYPDYFTRALPTPQRGPAVTIPIPGSTFSTASLFPSMQRKNNVGSVTGSSNCQVPIENFNSDTYDADAAPDFQTTKSTRYNFYNSSTQQRYASLDAHKNYINVISGDGGDIGFTQGTTVVADAYALPANTGIAVNDITSTGGSGITISAMRDAFALQRYYEALGRAGGGRYIEILKAIYGVSPSDDRMTRPEYLFGGHYPINITQVTQTSATSAVSPLGQTGAFSLTGINQENCFTQSFTEFGYIMGLVCVRTNNSYCQGINKMWRHTRPLDFYTPQFANLGEQPIMKSELVCDDANKNDVFGYRQAWSEYRYLPNLVTGYIAPNAGDAALSAWTYTNNFASAPTLNKSFTQQDRTNFTRTLATADSPYDFVADFYIDATYVRIMPLDSIPGLIDHD